MTTAPTQPLKVHQAVARALAANGVDTMFGLMGDANMYGVDYYIRHCGGRFVAAAHESGATMMALGYAAATGGLGVCSVTHGPGLTNTITGLVEGVKGALPLLLLCGDTDVEDRDNNQNVAQREFVIDAGAGFEQLRAPKTVAQDVARAIRRALAERRPIVLNMPLELDWKEVEDFRPIQVHLPERRAVVTASEDLDNAIGMIAAARRPVILVGRGATSPEARASILKLARRIEAPLMTTLKAKDLFRGEPFNLGICGTASTPSAVETMLESDCLIAFGASLSRYTTSLGTFLRNKKLIQVNQEPAEIGKAAEPDAGLVGDPGGVADLIVHWLDEAEIPPSGYCSDALAERISADVPTVGGETKAGTVDHIDAVQRLDRLLPENRLIVSDGGRFMFEAWKRISVPGPDSFLACVNFASIGLGLSHAIGAAMAKPDRPIVVLVGDGGFMHAGLTEFNTAVRYGARLIVIVFNDGAYGAEITKFEARGMPAETVLFDWPDLAPVAIALGGDAVTVRSEADWEAVDAAIRKQQRPLLIDLKLDPDKVPFA